MLHSGRRSTRLGDLLWRFIAIAQPSKAELRPAAEAAIDVYQRVALWKAREVFTLTVWTPFFGMLARHGCILSPLAHVVCWCNIAADPQ
jgi:hypothetical protein